MSLWLQVNNRNTHLFPLLHSDIFHAQCQQGKWMRCMSSVLVWVCQSDKIYICICMTYFCFVVQCVNCDNTSCTWKQNTHLKHVAILRISQIGQCKDVSIADISAQYRISWNPESDISIISNREKVALVYLQKCPVAIHISHGFHTMNFNFYFFFLYFKRTKKDLEIESLYSTCL